MDGTNISWTDATLNALEGCREISAGCDHCYAASVALRFGKPGMHYAGLAAPDGDGGAKWTGAIRMHPEKLELPLRWQRPRRIFVNSMSDLFYAPVPVGFVDRHFATFALAQRHTFQILTKRPDRMARYLNDPETPRRLVAHARNIFAEQSAARKNALRVVGEPIIYVPSWPLPNVWVGTSIENADAYHRAAYINQCPAAVRFVSAEPLIGPVNLDGWLGEHAIGWVIVGGESGPHFRPMDLDWARSLRDQCAAVGVPFFYKQGGGFKPGTDATLDGIEHHAFPKVEQMIGVA